jgi:uncharacterized phage-like protein YoqJ
MNHFIVAFTGHRSYHHEAAIELDLCVARLYDEGARTFRVGMAEGFDIAAAEAVIRLRKSYGDIRIEAYVPFPSFAKNFSSVDSIRYKAIIAECDSVTYAMESYNSSAFMLRNDILVADAQVVVAWWDGSRSGTGYTVGRARSNKSRIINLYPRRQLEIEF